MPLGLHRRHGMQSECERDRISEQEAEDAFDGLEDGMTKSFK